MLSQPDVDEHWAELAQQLQFESAGNVKAAAQRWTTFITSFLGALGFAGAAFTPGRLRDLPGGALLPVELLSAVVVLAGLTALVSAARASGVVPQFLFPDGPGYRRFSLESAEVGARWLNVSRAATVTAVACLLGVALVTVLVRDPVRPGMALVFRTGQPALCGQPVTGAGGVVALVVKGGQQVALSGLTSIQTVAACP